MGRWETEGKGGWPQVEIKIRSVGYNNKMWFGPRGLIRYVG